MAASVTTAPVGVAIDYAQLHDFATACLFEAFGEQACGTVDAFKHLFDEPPFIRVNTTIRTRGRLRGSMSGEGVSLGTQIRNAVLNAARDKRFASRLAAADLHLADIEIWLQTAAEVVSPSEIAGEQFLELGVDGAEVELNGKLAYYKPSVAITSGKRTVPRFMSALCRKAGLPENSWREPGTRVLRTKWIAVPALARRASAQPVNVISRSDVRRWLEESAGYLIRSRQASGNFTYIYDPINDREVLEPGSRVRFAGCLYALARYYDSPYYDPADREFAAGLQAIAASQAAQTIEWRTGRIVPEGRRSERGKLGGTALLALALGARSLRKRFVSLHSSLCESIRLMQTPAGRFLTHFGSNVEHPRSAEFFSGQALLCFVQQVEAGETSAIHPCTRAFAAYCHHFASQPSSAFAGWHVEVWSKMALLTKCEKYANFAFDQTDWLLRMQLISPRCQSWLGGFSAAGQIPKYSSIVFLEAVTRAYQLAVALGIEHRIERYRNAIQSGLKFCAGLRLSDREASWFPNPERSKGGVAYSPLDRRVRCDLPQHFITLCLSLLEARDLF